MKSSLTAATFAWYRQEASGPPIGEFTSSIVAGLQGGAVASLIDNSITAHALFAYAEAKTGERTSQRQTPYRRGDLLENVSEYVPKPPIEASISSSAHRKSSYTKLLRLCQALREGGSWKDEREFYRKGVLKAGERRKSFLTPYITTAGALRYKPIRYEVVERYIRFLRDIGFMRWREVKRA